MAGVLKRCSDGVDCFNRTGAFLWTVLSFAGLAALVYVIIVFRDTMEAFPSRMTGSLTG